ncbi:MAG: sporulation integral membrane protein YtvI [Eubacterium sp.]
MEYEKRKKFIINFIYGALILLIVYIVLQYGLGLVTPFLCAFIIAYLLRKPTVFLTKRFKIPYKLVAFFLVLLFYCTIGLLISLLGVKLISSIADFMVQLPVLYSNTLDPFLNTVFDSIEKALYGLDPNLVVTLNEFFKQFVQSLGNMVSNLSVKVVAAVSGYATSLPGLFIELILMIISTFFMATDYDKLTGFILRQFTGKGKEFLLRIKEYIVGTLFACIFSYAIIMSITFVELSIGLSFLGISNAILVAFSIALFDILPILGTGGIMIPWTIITALQGNYPMAIGLLILYLLITVIRNILEPKIVGSQIGLHPVVTLISMFVGAQLFGVIGLFGFPITLSLLSHLNDTGTIQLFK